MSGPARVVLVLLAVSAIAAQAVLESPVYRRPPGEEPVVSLYRHGTGERRTIPMEEYVAGVVAAEMDPRWPVEALAAQAVIARTFAVERLARGGVRGVHGTDVCDDPGHFQAYDPDAITPQVRRAVARTRGLVLTYGGSWLRPSTTPIPAATPPRPGRGSTSAAKLPTCRRVRTLTAEMTCAGRRR